MAAPGEIYRHGGFYLDEQNTWRVKYLVVLAFAPAGDLIFRLLTSRQRDRPRNPPCFHGDPFPGYCVGLVGGPLAAETWFDLRSAENYDERDFATELGSGVLQRVAALPVETLRALLDCAARAPDSTHQQSRAMRDQIASLPIAR